GIGNAQGGLIVPHGELENRLELKSTLQQGIGRVDVKMDEAGTAHDKLFMTGPAPGSYRCRTAIHSDDSHESGQHIHPGERADREGAERDECGEVFEKNEHLHLPCCYNVLISSSFVPVYL